MLSKFSIKKPFTILVAVVIVIVFGVIALTKMTPDLFPKINTPYVIVMTTYPGASPEEAESEITKPMEQQLATLSNIKNVTSVSAANYSMIQLEFSDSVNMDSVSVDIRDKIDQIEGVLPDTAGTPGGHEDQHGHDAGGDGRGRHGRQVVGRGVPVYEG